MIRSILIITLSACLVGCVQIKPDATRDEYLSRSTRVYKGETRERVLRAAESVLRQQDPTDVSIEFGLNGLVAKRHYVVNLIVAGEVGDHVWQIDTEPAEGGIRAAMAISKTPEVLDAATRAAVNQTLNSHWTLYAFWARMDYMLGLREDWLSCDDLDRVIARDRTGTIGSTAGICGVTHQPGPVPAPLGPVSKKPS